MSTRDPQIGDVYVVGGGLVGNIREGAPTQWAYDQACKALAKHRADRDRYRAALAELVRLKDGPRDAEYERRKPLAWQNARSALEGKKK